MARDLKLNVDGNSGGGQRALEEVAAASKAAAHEADRMAAQFRQAQNDAAKLDRQLAETAIATRALAREFAKTGDSGIKAQLDAQKKSAAELKRLRSDIIGDTEKAAKDAERFATQAAASLKKATSFANPGEGFSFGGALPALGAVAAVPALATAGGAALAGIGAIGAGAGVASAVLGDPKAFQGAWDDATSQVKKDFFDAGAVFTGPTLDAIKTIGPTIDSWNLGAALAPAAKYVPILVDGLERAATGVEHGIADGIAKAGPAVQALSQGLAQLGQAAGDALSHIADGAEGGAQALHDTLSAVSAVVEGFGLITEGAEKTYEAINNHPLIAAGFTAGLSIPASLLAKALGDVDEGGQAVGRTLNGVKTTIDQTGHSVALTADDFQALSKGLAATQITADTLAGQMSDKIFNSLLAADRATLGWDESLTSLSESLKTNGTQLDIHSQKGQANREAILGSVEANIRQYDTNIAAGQTAIQAAAAYDQNTAALEKQLRKAGLTQAAVDGLIGKYRSVPDRVDTNIAIEGLANAIHDLDDVLRRINGLPSRKDITIYTHTGTIGGKEGPAFYARGGIRHAATGLIVGPSDPGTMIGEPQTGGEALIPLRGIAPARAADLARTALGGYGYDVVSRRIPPNLWGGGGGSSSGPPTVNFSLSGSASEFDQFMARWFMKAQRTGAVQIGVN